MAREVFDTLLEATVLIERSRKAKNTVRLHSSLGNPAPDPGLALPDAISRRFAAVPPNPWASQQPEFRCKDG